MAITIIDAPSPNHNGRQGSGIDCIVIHDTECETAKAALSWFESPASQVSAHDVIDRDGTTYRRVPDELRAWHAGTSALGGRPDGHAFTIGIELGGCCSGTS